MERFFIGPCLHAHEVVCPCARVIVHVQRICVLLNSNIRYSLGIFDSIFVIGVLGKLVCCFFIIKTVTIRVDYIFCLSVERTS